MNRTAHFDREKALFITGLILCVFGLFSTYAVVSYLFTWKADQDFIDATRYFDESMRVANGAGRLGLKWGVFLVSGCFGLASLMLCGLTCWVGAMMVLSRKVNWVKVSILALPVTLMVGLILAWTSLLVGHGTDTVFGGGIGGNAGVFIVKAMEDLVGPVITICILLAMVFGTLVLLSDKFFHALQPSAVEPAQDGADEAAEADPEPEYEPEPESEPEYEPEPETVPVYEQVGGPEGCY